MKRRSILKLIVCLLLLTAAAAGLTYFISIEGRLAKQLTVLNTMLLVMILAKAAKAAFGEIDSWVEDSREQSRKETYRQVEQQDRTGSAPAHNSGSEIAKAHAELRKELDHSAAAAADPPVTRDAPVKEEKAAPAIKFNSELDMVGYAELVNPHELIFNSTPKLRVVNSKNTFAIYSGEGGYCLMVSEHWLGNAVQYEPIMNEHFRELFAMSDPVSGHKHILRSCSPAGLARSEDGTYYLTGKGRVEMDII